MADDYVNGGCVTITAMGYMHWLHTRWPAGQVEPLPAVDPDGRTNIPGVFIAGDLTGIPLLKFSLDSGARAARLIAGELRKNSAGPANVDDLVIIGAGVAGMAAALEAKALGLSFQIIESSEAFSTLVNFPKAKPIYTYPADMTPEGRLKVSADIKENLIEELRAQTKGIDVVSGVVEKIRRRGDVLEVLIQDRPSLIARRVIIAIGRSGNYRKLDVPGETLDKVYNRLHDPKDFAGKRVLVVGGGDSALETAIALKKAGAEVTVSYRQKEFSRPKTENIAELQELAVRRMMPSQVVGIKSDSVLVRDAEGKTQSIPNDVVFTMIGREAPLDFFRRCRIRIAGEWTAGRITACAAFVLFCLALYNWKSGGWLSNVFYEKHWFPTNIAMNTAHPDSLSPLGGERVGVRGASFSLIETISISASSPSFWYALAYSLIVVIFGIRRIKRRKTPYVRVQTLTLMAIQVFPLFLLPEIILPWLGHNHLLPAKIADALFPVANYGHGREYWRAYGFILAWPLMVYNVFTGKPMLWWLVISFIQTFIFIPAIVYFWGKGAYCGWICSCGALAETLGDTHRSKMPHGPGWNRLNMAGQGILAVVFVLLGLRVAGWVFPSARINWMFDSLFLHPYKWLIDVGLAGVIGYGLYFWYSGRVWCRLFCPLAALMHIYARFSRFRILADKKKCISCNVCTSVCHQGIDIMNFANKGLPMNDPQCVRCSACVQMCPTGVLSFGQIDENGDVVAKDSLPARLA